ncbi:uncharacterized protein [Arachis hypogaea]|uniref:uncharacterized protein n=1 Tax=Arachis hypogaea TaxID=3818 RepID=UPI003B2184E0
MKNNIARLKQIARRVDDIAGTVNRSFVPPIGGTQVNNPPLMLNRGDDPNRILNEEKANNVANLMKKGVAVDIDKCKVIFDSSLPKNKKELQSFLEKTRTFTPLLKLKQEEEFKWEEEHQQVFDQIKQYLTSSLILVPVKQGRLLRLYIAVSETSLGGMLTQKDEDGSERVVYYLSRMLIAVKTRYSTQSKNFA